MSRHQIAVTPQEPFDGAALLVFLGRHAVPGVEAYRETDDPTGRRIHYSRALRLPNGPAEMHLSWSAGRLSAEFELAEPSDLAAAQDRLHRLCNLSAEPVRIAAHLSRDPQLRELVAAAPGLRVPGTVDVHEHLLRTMVGQQISLAGAANCAAKLVTRFGDGLPGSSPPLSHLFPTAAALAAADPSTLPMPRARGRALVEVATALADGSLVLTPQTDPGTARAALLECRGVGPWTADYVLMRGLHQPDVLLASDLAIRRELTTRGIRDTQDWSPWRSYATMHLWRAYTGWR